jgi:hypothetical protein
LRTRDWPDFGEGDDDDGGDDDLDLAGIPAPKDSAMVSDRKPGHDVRAREHLARREHLAGISISYAGAHHVTRG